MAKKGSSKVKDRILVICAHNDDQVIGCGGTLVNYRRQGLAVKVLVSSFGEVSHLHLKPDVIKKMRQQESDKADRMMGISGTVYLGLKDGQLGKEFSERITQERVLRIIDEFGPTKMFTHSVDDPHPDHRAVHNFVVSMIKDKKITCDVYSFDIWNLFSLKNKNVPKLIVDISETFDLKIKAFRVHKSQWLTIFNTLWKLYFKDFTNGLKNGYRYAETFIKLN